MSATVFIQGADFKARSWSRHFVARVRFFVSLRDQIGLLLNSKRGDLIIYRYQNNDARLGVSLFDALLLILNLFKARLMRVKVVWICHNVDTETSPYHKWLEKLRRHLLSHCANLVLVLDSAFLSYAPAKSAGVISFGKKVGGHTEKATRDAISNFSEQRDLTILIAGQDGLKYLSFSRIPELHALLSERFGRVGFVVAGISPERRFTDRIEEDVLRISEKNIDESAIAGSIDYIYRENDDISMPYTLYAAVTAQIPMLTWPGNVLEVIVAREGVGISADALWPDTPAPPREVYVNFIERYRWDSLAKILHEHGLLK